MSTQTKNKIKKYKYIIVLISLLSFILSPIYIAFSPFPASIIVGLNFTIVIISGLFICQSIKNSYIYYILGIATILSIWMEFSYPFSTTIKVLRLFTSCLMFLFLFYVLINELVKSHLFDLKSILGAISGYLFIGLIGGVIFELLFFINPSFFTGANVDLGYSFYYFSFISITTVGYGDITPSSPPSQAITILVSIAGQLYLTIVVALFVGKYLSTTIKIK